MNANNRFHQRTLAMGQFMDELAPTEERLNLILIEMEEGFHTHLH